MKKREFVASRFDKKKKKKQTKGNIRWKGNGGSDGKEH